MKEAAGKVLLSSRMRYADQTLFLGRARLYPDRINLSGWSWTGRYRRRIMLTDIERVRWWSGRARSANLVLYLHDGDYVELHLEASGLWKYEIESLQGRQIQVVDDLPEHLSSASAA